jgi:hypothetical protein
MVNNIAIVRWIITLFILILPYLIRAGDRSTWNLSAQYQYIQPVGSLNGWFAGTPRSLALSIGHNDGSAWQYQWRLEAKRFSEENRDKLVHKNLGLALDLFGAGMESQYQLSQWGQFLRPYVLVDIALYRWFSERAALDISDPENGSVINVPGRNQKDWSWALGAGFGIHFYPIKPLSLSLNLRYRLVIGELWPALALELENVSGFQMLLGGIALHWYF